MNRWLTVSAGLASLRGQASIKPVTIVFSSVADFSSDQRTITRRIAHEPDLAKILDSSSIGMAAGLGDGLRYDQFLEFD